jgi:hypothetical protein
MFNLDTIGSSAASEVRINPIAGTATVTFANGYGPYTYRNISRRQLAKAAALEFFGGVVSIGEFINGMAGSRTFRR